MLNRYFNRKGPTTADAMIINVKSILGTCIRSFHHLSFVERLPYNGSNVPTSCIPSSTVITSTKHRWRRWRWPSPTYFLMHLSILQVYYEPLDITGPALSSNWIVWCRLQRANKLLNDDVWTIQEWHCWKEFDSLWLSFGFNLVYVLHVVFFGLVILQCSTRLSLPPKLIRTGVVWRLRSFWWVLERSCPPFGAPGAWIDFASTSSDMTGIHTRKGRLWYGAFWCKHLRIFTPPLKLTNFAPENGWLEDYLPLAFGLFSGASC